MLPKKPLSRSAPVGAKDSREASRRGPWLPRWKRRSARSYGRIWIRLALLASVLTLATDCRGARVPIRGCGARTARAPIVPPPRFPNPHWTPSIAPPRIPVLSPQVEQDAITYRARLQATKTISDLEGHAVTQKELEARFAEISKRSNTQIKLSGDGAYFELRFRGRYGTYSTRFDLASVAVKSAGGIMTYKFTKAYLAQLRRQPVQTSYVNSD